MATSILQGGPGFPLLHPAAYSYICGEEYTDKFSDNADVPDPLVRDLLDRVSSLYLCH